MRKLLIVSTDTQFLNSMQAELRCRHFEVTGLKSANNLFRELQIIKPDILIVDFILDELNGGSLCHQLKCNPNTRSLPVVILSDYTGMERFSAKFGCDNIIYKQADIYKMTDALVDAIKSTNVPS
ncbi:MAG: hypothetical protein JWR76_867 [Mucilaginibacter sp.]|nr:hypothetical protein [Mucilaginibacter sp.]